MKFKDIVAISGLPGLYEMISAKPGGATLRGLQDGKVQFVSNRIHTFSPLDKISMYTVDTDSEPLGNIIQNIQKFEKEQNGTLPQAKDKPENLRSFIKTVLPNYDESRVYVSDIQKLIKWYSLLKTVEELEFEPETPAETKTAETADTDSAETAE
ncbi:hypothetical protein C7N43_17890 [Sphingobacteriales bacterium UPWRP_1]|nr:hypothetical protein B6N25_10925 [Sphingobacteriales bacterium TSM_CSS]PSJ75652.1 hypothetical protein C7N43_17890 [Sphingobacteriales bacterium UPWRP_1]